MEPWMEEFDGEGRRIDHLRPLTDKIWEAILEATSWDESKRRLSDSFLHAFAFRYCSSRDDVTVDDLRQNWEKHLPDFKKSLATLAYFK